MPRKIPPVRRMSKKSLCALSMLAPPYSEGNTRPRFSAPYPTRGRLRKRVIDACQIDKRDSTLLLPKLSVVIFSLARPRYKTPKSNKKKTQRVKIFIFLELRYLKRKIKLTTNTVKKPPSERVAKIPNKQKSAQIK